jgi:hypothetical protein
MTAWDADNGAVALADALTADHINRDGYCSESHLPSARRILGEHGCFIPDGRELERLRAALQGLTHVEPATGRVKHGTPALAAIGHGPAFAGCLACAALRGTTEAEP